MKKRTIIYDITKFFVAIAHRIFYKQIIVEGRENIPSTGALIFAPNHQNALMDALAVLFTNRRLTVFLARGDIFKNKLSAAILTRLKILPVFRIRDGKEALEKNDEIFIKTVEVLEYNTCLCLFPETTHTDKRRLQQLKKGVQRIAFQAEQKNNYSLNIHIIPVGLYYSYYPSSGGILIVKYGKPLKVSDYRDLYNENEQKAMLKIRDDITTRMKPLVIDIQNPDYYEMYEYLRDVYYHDALKKLNLKINYKNKFIADKKIIDALDNYVKTHNDELAKLNIDVNNYKEQLKSNSLEDKVFYKPISLTLNILNTILMLILSPIFISAYIVNAAPYSLAMRLIKGVKDKQFFSSFKFVIGLILFPINYIILTALVFIFSDYTFINIFFSISLWVSLYIFFRLRDELKNSILRWRLYMIKMFNQNTFNEIKTKREEIIKVMDIVMSYEL